MGKKHCQVYIYLQVWTSTAAAERIFSQCWQIPFLHDKNLLLEDYIPAAVCYVTIQQKENNSSRSQVLKKKSVL